LVKVHIVYVNKIVNKKIITIKFIKWVKGSSIRGKRKAIHPRLLSEAREGRVPERN